jgi:hypothetical protein
MKYLNTKEVSEKFGCTINNVQKLIRESKLTPINPKHSRGYLFDKNYINSIKAVYRAAFIDNLSMYYIKKL